MKELVILRHAEARHGHGLRDRDRPLTDRGARHAGEVGRRLRDEGVRPGIALSSAALRAEATARTVAEVSGCEVRLVEELYLAPPQDYLEALAVHGNPYDAVLLVGHNPGLEDLVELLGGARKSLPPAGMVRLVLELDDWIEILGKPRGPLRS